MSYLKTTQGFLSNVSRSVILLGLKPHSNSYSVQFSLTGMHQKQRQQHSILHINISILQHYIALIQQHLSAFPFLHSFVLSFFLSFITQFDGVDANERAFQHKHTRTRSHSHSTNSFYIFRASHMIFPLVVGCFLAMLVRHSCIYSPYFICAAILCLYATDTIKVFDYTQLYTLSISVARWHCSSHFFLSWYFTS